LCHRDHQCGYGSISTITGCLLAYDLNSKTVADG